MIHKHAGELLSHGFRKQRCTHGGIHPAGESQQHPAIVYFATNICNRPFPEASHGPVPRRAAYVKKKVPQHGAAVLCVIHLRMELYAVKPPRLVADGGVGAGVGDRRYCKAGRDFFHIVPVAHPGDPLRGQSAEQGAARIEAGQRLAVFPGGV